MLKFERIKDLSLNKTMKKNNLIITLTAFCFLLLSGVNMNISANNSLNEILSVPFSPQDWGIKNLKRLHQGTLNVAFLDSQKKLSLNSLHEDKEIIPEETIITKPPSPSSNYFLVSHFEKGTINELGGHFNHFKRKPSSAKVWIGSTQDNRNALIFNYDQQPGSYSGMWMHLYNFKAPVDRRVYFDASSYKYLTFWIRGTNGNEDLLLKVADLAWDKRGDSVKVSQLNPFIKSGKITQKWQQVVIPLSSFPDTLNKKQLATIVFQPPRPAQGTVEIKTMTFSKDNNALPELPAPAFISGEVNRKTEKATWLWQTDKMLKDPLEKATLLTFLTTNNFTTVFIQLPGLPDKNVLPGEIIFDTQAMQKFIQELKQSGLKVYALDGYKKYVLPNWHKGVLATVKRIGEYNASVPDISKFDGIHYDIEPYLMPGFAGANRIWLLNQKLILLEKMNQLCKQYQLDFGIDIPFWYDEIDPYTQKVTQLTFNNKTRSLLEHVIELVDHIGIMDYRTSSTGPDGVVRHGNVELDIANKLGKKVYIGLETIKLPDEESYSFSGPPSSGLPLLDDESWIILDSKGNKFFLVPQNKLETFQELMKKQNILESDLYYWSIKSRIFMASNRVSFYSLGFNKLNKILKESENEIKKYPSFAGFAIHDYMGIKHLMNQ